MRVRARALVWNSRWLRQRPVRMSLKPADNLLSNLRTFSSARCGCNLDARRTRPTRTARLFLREHRPILHSRCNKAVCATKVGCVLSSIALFALRLICFISMLPNMDVCNNSLNVRARMQAMTSSAYMLTRPNWSMTRARASTLGFTTMRATLRSR